MPLVLFCIASNLPTHLLLVPERIAFPQCLSLPFLASRPRQEAIVLVRDLRNPLSGRGVSLLLQFRSVVVCYNSLRGDGGDVNSGSLIANTKWLWLKNMYHYVSLGIWKQRLAPGEPELFTFEPHPRGFQPSVIRPMLRHES